MNWVHFVIKQMRTLFDAVPVIYPDSIFKIIWDILLVLLIIVNIFYIPMKLSFHFSTDGSYASSLFLETVPTSFFVFDIFLTFNTAFYHNGDIQTKKKEIFKHYMRNNFIWDLIVVIPFFISQFDTTYTEFTLLLRVTRVRSMV